MATATRKSSLATKTAKPAKAARAAARAAKPAKPAKAGKPAKAAKAAKPARKIAARKAAAKAARPPKEPGSQGAPALLRADHQRVSALFDQYEKARSAVKKKTIVSNICMELGIHAQAEEEIFYPAVKAALKDKKLVPEANVEHATLKALIAEVEGKEPDGEMFDARIKVMSEYVKHHVKEEETEMFPRARKTKLDMKALGAQIEARKEELKASWPPAKPGLISQVMESITGR